MATRPTTRKRESSFWPPIDFYEDPRETKGRSPLDMLQTPSFFKIIPTLMAYFRGDPSVYINGALPVRDNPSDLRDCLWPDCCVAFGVNREAIMRETGYNIRQVGKPPDFTMEIASASTASRDINVKRELYDRMGVPEYWLFDPSGGDHYGRSLSGNRLVNGEYHPIDIAANEDGLLYGYSSALGLNVCVIEDGEVTGRYLPQLQEPVSGRYLRDLPASERVLSEERESRQVAEHERQIAEAELDGERRARAAAEAELAELRDRLRRQD